MLYSFQILDHAMPSSADDVIPRSHTRADLQERVEQAMVGAEKIHLLLTEDASEGLGDVSSGRVKDARQTLSAMKRHRTQRTPAD